MEKGIPFNHELVEEGKADVIRMNHFLEHVKDLDGFLEQVAKLGRNGCEVRINVPHYLYVNGADADHETLFSEITLDTYCVDHEYPTPKPQLFRMKSKEFVFCHGKLIGLVRRFMGDNWVRHHIPNTVEEIRFKLEVVK